MIRMSEFKEHLHNTFDVKTIYYDEFKPDLHFIELDCFAKETNYKLSIEMTPLEIKFSTVSKIPELDFSLYEFSKATNQEAEDFLFHIIKTGWPSSK